MMNVGVILLLLGYFQITDAGSRNQFSLVNNKYDNILVAISDDIPQSDNLINRIKETFTEFSRDLFVATRRRAFVGGVTILAPRLWSGRPGWGPSGTETFQRANVIIDKPPPGENHGPKTKQPFPCGHSAEYIRLSPLYLTRERLSLKYFGPFGKTILHEFGHLRWGFFEEYAEGDKDFYHSKADDGSTKIEAVRCSKQIQGNMVKRVRGRYESCDRDPTTSLPEEDCVFAPNTTHPSMARASLMCFHFLNNIDSFCDNDTSDPLNLHNDEAPNKHNAKCGWRSQWEIMREHVDFKDENNPPLPEGVHVDTTPVFRVLKRGAPRTVLVIDISGSMDTNDRLTKATQAAEEAIQQITPTGISSVGVVTFHTTAAIVHNLTPVSNDVDKQSLINSLPSSTRGSTGIGGGLMKAMKMLQNNKGLRGGKIILLSDGQENKRPYISEVLQNLTDGGVRVDTLLLSNAADPKLIALARDTGGRSFFATDSEASTSLVDAFTDSVGEEDSDVIKVFGKSASVQPKKSGILKIPIDDDIGNNTVFTFKWTTADKPQLTLDLRSPSGSRVPVPAFDSSKSMRISIAGVAEPGIWVLNITNRHGFRTWALQVTVTSRPRSPGDKPITLSSQIGQATVNFSDPSSMRLVIFATLTKGYTPVVGADVHAIVESEKSETKIKLLDNGSGPDITKEDGTYSGYFMNFDGNGGYAVKVEVFDYSGNARLKTSGSSAGESAFAMCTMTGTCDTFGQPSSSVPAYKNISSISRVASSGSFRVVNQPFSPTASTVPVDMFPPEKITDLAVLKAFYENSTVTLQWTAVGDDLDSGTAARYDLRVHTRLQNLRTQFSSCPTVNQSSVIKGNLSQPKTAGEVETFVITLDSLQKEITFYFAVKAVDDSGKVGELSNVVPVAFTLQQPDPIIIEINWGSSTSAYHVTTEIESSHVTSTTNQSPKGITSTTNRQSQTTFSLSGSQATDDDEPPRSTTVSSPSAPLSHSVVTGIVLGTVSVCAVVVTVVAILAAKAKNKHHGKIRVSPKTGKATEQTVHGNQNFVVGDCHV